VKLALAASLDFPDYQVRWEPLASRATGACAGTLDRPAWAWRVRPACRVTRDPRDPPASGSRACKDCVDRLENMGSGGWWEGLVPWAPQAIANFATPWPCRPTGAPPKRGPKLLAAPDEKKEEAARERFLPGLSLLIRSSTFTLIHPLIQFYVFLRPKLCS